MSLYCTLPRRSRLGLRNQIPPIQESGSDHQGLVYSGSYYFPHRPISYCSDHSQIQSSLCSINTFNTGNDCHSVLSPTENSDTVTFTESVTSTFDDYSPKVYYASDSFDLSNIIHGAKSGKQKEPNYYGNIDEEDSDNSDTVESEMFDFNRFENACEKSQSTASITNTIGYYKTNSISLRSRSRQNIHNISMRFRKLYRPLFRSDTIVSPADADRKTNQTKLKLIKLYWKNKVNFVLNQQRKWFHSSSGDSVDPVTNLPVKRLERYFSYRRTRSKSTLESSIQTSSVKSPLTRTYSVAGIKKRPLSMQYDLNRLNQSTQSIHKEKVNKTNQFFSE